MPKLGVSRAKLTRPRLHSAVPRERLFAKLDNVRERRRAVCVVGPPGAGKTTLVASWSDARDIDGIWYQVDSGDADPATFFFYLGEAAKPFSRKGQRPLPALTPEYRHDTPGFSRRFFRDLFARLPHGACLVLDNYQEVPSEEVFHQLVADAVAEVPEAATLIVVSRRDPPNCYARLIANDNAAFLDWEDLRLTPDETHAVLLARGDVTRQAAERIHVESGGWAAGLTLILEGHRRSGAGVHGEAWERDALFDYFANQILGEVPETVRRFLLITAILPQIPVSIAKELTGEVDAGRILEDLYQRHLFTHRRVGSEHTYWYHALFRSFLNAQSNRAMDNDERRAYERRGARLLEASGANDDAFALFVSAEDWDAIVRLVERRAAELLSQGRDQTLRSWILAVPRERLEQDPWMQYWLGISALSVDQTDARRHLEAAFASFEATGNRPGQALAAAGVLDTYYFEWSNFGPMAHWVNGLERFMDENLFADAPDRELKLWASMLVGILYGAPAHAMLRRCVTRVSEMLDENLDANSKLKAATYLLTYCNLSGELHLGQSVFLRAAPLLSARDIAPLNELWWFLRLGHYHTMCGDLAAARIALDHVREVACARGLSGLRSAALLIRNFELLLACLQRDLETAQRMLVEMDSLAIHERPMDIFHLASARSATAGLRRDPKALSVWGQAQHEAARVAGMTYTVVLGLVQEAHGVVERDSPGRLEEIVTEVRALITNTYMDYFELEVQYLLTYAALRRGPRGSVLSLVETTIRMSRERHFHYPTILRLAAAVPAVLCAALDEGIETDYILEVIRKYRLRPPSSELDTWPWPVMVLTLGSFDLRIAGTSLQFSGKLPRKPLALLKAIIALGGTEVPQAKLIDALWSAYDGDAAKRALGVTLVRLRKLLGTHDAIEVTDERLSLNRELCWVDVYAFESAMKQAERARAEGLHAQFVAQAQRALARYKGEFLSAERDEVWAVQLRQRIRGKFIAAVEDLGQAYEQQRDWARAIHTYRRGLEVEDLAENFYLGLMRCYCALHRPAEGIAVFRRLRQTLSIVLGVAPSPESEAAITALRELGHVRTD